MTKLKRYLSNLPKQFPEILGLLLLWGFTLSCVLSNSREAWSGQSLGTFSLCFIPIVFSLGRAFDAKRFIGALVLSLFFMVLCFKVFKDTYFIQPFWVFYIESTLILGSLFFAIIYCMDKEVEKHFDFTIKFFISLLILIGLERFLEGIFQGFDKYNWKDIRVAVWAICYFFARRLNTFSISKDLHSKIHQPSFLFTFGLTLFFSAWAFTVFRLGASYHKIYFYFAIFSFGFWLPRRIKVFLILLLATVNIHTGWQVIQMNYEVSYSYLFLLGLSLKIFLISQELKSSWRMLAAPISLFILVMGFTSPLHLYHLNLTSTKALLVEVATRMEMYQKGKIVPINKEISNEAKKRFGKVLFTLIKYHPVDSFQDIFKPNLKAIFQHSRPLYSDETYNKFKSRLTNVLSRLNINWYVRANIPAQGKNVTILSIDHNTQVTQLKSEDFVSRSLNFQFKLKDGRVLSTRGVPRAGQVQVLINDQVVETISFQEVVYKHVPDTFTENSLRLHLQPGQLERVIEIQGVRIRVKINQIYGRKEKDKFNFNQIVGQVFLKTF